MKTVAVAYCRTSSETQKDNQTIQLQVENLERYVRTHDIEIQEWFKDDGVSGGLEKRPELARMMKCLEENEVVKVVLIYSLSRLARDLYIQEGLIKEFSKLGKEIISATEPDLGSDDPLRKAFRQMLGVFSEFERAMINLRMRSGRDSSVAKGKWHGGLVYGYDSEDGILKINQTEALIIKQIYHLKRYQKKSPWQIAKHLNKSNVPTKTNAKWHSSTIINILNNKIYKGILSYKGQSIVGLHEQII